MSDSDKRTPPPRKKRAASATATAKKAAVKPAAKPVAKAGSSKTTAKPGVTASRKRPVKAAPARPADIDDAALNAVIGDLGGSASRTGASARTSVANDAFEVFGTVTDSLGKAKDAAIARGMVDPKGIERLMGDVLSAWVALGTAIAGRIGGEYTEDDFGFDKEFTEHMAQVLGLLYDYYWRVDVEGVTNVPGSGPAMLVANHAGAGLPFDGGMIKMAVLREHPEPRHVRALVLDWAMGMPWLGDLFKMTGQVLACTPNATDLLDRGEAIAVFPEGVKGMAKPFSKRYNLERFGRGGFVRVALKTGAPIVPVAVVGSEETYPKIGNIPYVNRLIGAPFVPLTPTFPLFGLAGLIPLPAKWNIEFCEPIDVSGYPPEAADDRSFVLELSERVRSVIQERVRENLLKRSTPFW